MSERRLSFKEALNQAIRAGAGAGRKPEGRFRQKTFRMGFQPQFRWEKALAMASAMEDEEVVRKLQLRK